MDCEELRELSKQLREGAAADIWYDAGTFGDKCDENYQTQIETAQQAMTSAADFLDRLAELIE